MGFAVRVRSAGQKYGPTCHQRDRADVTEFVTLVRLSSLGQHVGVLALAGYKRRKSALTANPICVPCCSGLRYTQPPASLNSWVVKLFFPWILSRRSLCRSVCVSFVRPVACGNRLVPPPCLSYDPLHNPFVASADIPSPE